jgi:hypothetical protein
MKYNSYEEWIDSQLSKLGLSKAICPHCGNDDQNLMAENLNFTHADHEDLNYQCHNRPKCGKYFKIGPLSHCFCGWEKDGAKALLEEMLDVISEKNSRGEPVIGDDHCGTVNWLLNIESRIRETIE